MPQYIDVGGQVVEFPDGMSQDEITKVIRTQMQPQAAQKAGSIINEIPRQVGLAARYGIEGPANMLQLFTEPIRAVQDRVTGVPTKPLGQLATGLADWMTLPSPQTPDERVVGDASRLVAGSGGFMGGARALASSLSSKVAPAVDSAIKYLAGSPVSGNAAAVLPARASDAARSTLSALTTNPMAQLTAAGGGGLASGASREAGGSGLEQFGAAVGGTVLGGLAPGAINSVIGKISQLRGSPMALEGKITLALKEAGVDWQSVPQGIRNQLLADVKKATATGGELNPDALRRLADFRMTNTTPTRGMLTLDPIQVTREQNLAKLGANSSDDALAALPMLQNRNNAQLINNLNRAGAAQGDPMAASRSSIDRITGIDATMGARVSGMYDAARNMPGGNVPLQRADLVNNIYNRLAQENKLAFLPKEVSDMIDDISLGMVKRGGQQFDVPFDAKALDNLMTTIATAQRGTKDGNVKAALSLVRQAIDETPITPVKTQYGGNQLVTEAGAKFLRDQDAQAPQFMQALNQAREAARQRFNWQESSKPVQAALDGMEPDKYFQRFIIGGSVNDAKALSQAGDKAAIKDAITAYLKDRALSGASDEVGKFSQSNFNSALKQIGKEKLGVFFSADEIQQLEANARAASYMQVQPVGSAVNNSNSGIYMNARMMDFISSVANKIPFGRQAIIDPLKSIDIALGERAAQNITPGLLMPQAQGSLLPFAAAPMASGLGLLSAPNKP